ncbi:MAG: preprotein translocase subunit Sec61beta [Methanomassiliicoccales archaeon]
MPKKKSDGFQSAAGLIRYFESEDEKAIKINPWFVIGMAVALIVIVELLGRLFPT